MLVLATGLEPARNVFPAPEEAVTLPIRPREHILSSKAQAVTPGAYGFTRATKGWFPSLPAHVGLERNFE